MRIMVAGAWRWPQYEDAFARGLKENGASVIRFETGPFFAGAAGALEAKLPLAGPATRRMGRALLARARQTRPDHVLFWRPTHLLPGVVRGLRRLGIATVSYNNDDPFSPLLAAETSWRRRKLWRLYRRCLPEFDRNFFYRQVNCDEALRAGARHAAVLMPCFQPERDRPIVLDDADRERFACDLVFAGHFEPDGRDGDLIALRDAGFAVKVWGDDSWSHSRFAAAQLGAEKPDAERIVPALGSDYSKALNGAKVCLCYMSKLNRDHYTRRCFEIPATGRPLLAERTAALRALFREDEEACFFSSREELLAKARHLVDDAAFRERISAGGLNRVWADGHDATSRAAQFLAGLSGSAGSA